MLQSVPGFSGSRLDVACSVSGSIAARQRPRCIY